LMKVTRWPMAMVSSSGVMPVAVMVIVGGPDGAVTGGVVEVGGVGDAGVDGVPPEHAASITTDRIETQRSTGHPSQAWGAPGIRAATVPRM